MGKWALATMDGEEYVDDDSDEIGNDMMDVKGWHEVRDLYLELKGYNKNVFPIKGFNINGVAETGYFINALKQRASIIKEMKPLPSVAIRNMKEDIRKERDYPELQRYRSDMEHFMAYFSLLGNRDENLRKKIYDKMFKAGTTLDQLTDFVEQKENLLGGAKYTKNMIKSLLNNNHGDLEIIYDKGKVMVVEVTGPQGIKDIGCNSLWCFTYGSGFDGAYRQWNNYSTNDIVYVIINFAKPTDSPDFMYVLIKPLPPDMGEDDEDSNVLYDMSNEPVYNPHGVLNHLLGTDTVNKLFTFGEEPPEPEPQKEKPFVDPNQLSLFEQKNKIKSILSEHSRIL
jgi:hypothetical protein